MAITRFAKAMVQHFVPFLQRRLIESRVAKVALIRLDARVNVFVLLEMRRPFKVAVAIGAFIRLLPRVGTLVARLVRAPAKPLVAKLAFVRFFFGVTAFMLPQIGVLTEGRRTKYTSEGLFPSMCPFVLLEVRLPSKVRLAILTLELAFLTVRPHVHSLLIEVLESARTVRTLVKRDARVHLFVFAQHV